MTVESTSYGTTTVDGTVRTTKTETLSEGFDIIGCAPTDWSTAVTTTACDTSQAAKAVRSHVPVTTTHAEPSVTAEAPAVDARDAVLFAPEPPSIEARAPSCPSPALFDGVLWPLDAGGDFTSLRAKLNTGKANGELFDWAEIRSNTVGFTGFFYLTKATLQFATELARDKAQYGVSSPLRTLAGQKTSQGHRRLITPQ